MNIFTIIIEPIEFVKGRKGILKRLTIVGSLLIVQMACMVTVVAAPAPMPGQIIQDPENPAFMLKNEDKNGDGLLDPYWLVGHGGPEGFFYGADMLSNWDQDSILDFIGQHGGNAIYIMAWGGDWTGSPSPDRYPHWHRWIEKMDQYGIVAFFIFYDDGIPHQGDATLAAMVNEFEMHPNIIWCICEEEHDADIEGEKASHIADVIRAADDYGHVIAIHDTWYPRIDMLGYQQRSNSVSDAHRRAVGHFDETRMSNSAEDHYADVNKKDPDRTRKVVWANAVAGNYFMQLGSWEQRSSRKPPEISEANYMRYASEFMESIPDLNKMRPSDGIVKSGNAWAFGRKNHYILYFESGGSATLDLSGSSGSLNVRWYDPRTGTSHSGSAITAGSSVSLMVPVGNDWVVEIGGASATATSTPATRTADESIPTPDPTLIQGGELARIGTGNMPDIAVDKWGNIHVAYARDQVLYYKKWTASTGLWSEEKNTGLTKGLNKFFVTRVDPDIVVGSDGTPYIHAWASFAKKTGSSWVSIPPLSVEYYRDTELAIDNNDVVYLLKRGGFDGGKLGVQKLARGSTSWTSCTDPDKGLNTTGISDHIYPDISINRRDNSIHIVQRHGPGESTYYHQSTDGAASWTHSKVTDNEPESPFVQVTSTGEVFVTDGNGNIYRKTSRGWAGEGQAVVSEDRELPELGADDEGNLYITSFGFHYNIRLDGQWGSSRRFARASNIGFVETAGYSDFAYAVCEEGASVKVYKSTREKPVPVDIMIVLIRRSLLC